MSRKNRRNGNSNTSYGNNGNGSHGNEDGPGCDIGTRKDWNAVATTFYDKKPEKGKKGKVQKGVLHHVRTRPDQTMAAICEWPELLLKMSQSFLTQANDGLESVDFLRFFARVPDECLLASFGRVGLDERFEMTWQRVRAALIGHIHSGHMIVDLANAIATCECEPISSIVVEWMGTAKSDDFLRAMFALIEGEDGKELAVTSKKDMMLIFLAVAKAGRVPTVKLGNQADLEPFVVDDPRTRIEFVPLVWKVEDTSIGLKLASLFVEFSELFELDSDRKRFLKELAEDEDRVSSELSQKWAVLRDSMKRWILGNGLFQLDFSTADEAALDVGVLGAIANPAGYEFPSFGLELKLFAFGRVWEEAIVIRKDGSIDLSSWPAEGHRLQRGYRLWLAMRAMEAIAKYATKSNGDGNRNTTSSDGDSLGRPVPPHFRRLGVAPSGKLQEASADSEARCLERFGFELPVGYTFAASPSIEAEKRGDDVVNTSRCKPFVLKA